MSAAAPPLEPLWDLENLARARRLCDWMFDQYARVATGHVAEVGAGIGTFTRRMVDAGADSVLAIEPDPVCQHRLKETFKDDPRVEAVAETLPGSPSLEAMEGSLDLVVSQNVLEHIADDSAAMRAMAAAVRPGGHLVALVPAHPRLFGELDRRFAHHRRYTRESLRRLVEQSGLAVTDVRAFNLLGVPGWWVQSRRRDPSLDERSLAAYEALLRVWRPVEDRVRFPWGLSVIAHARRRAG
jgi:SAM-dependent methyltransferase